MTARRWTVGLLAGSLLVSALATGERFFVAGFALCLGLLAACLALCAAQLFGFKYTQSLSAHQAVKGARITLRFELHNDRFFPFSFIRMSYHTPVSSLSGAPQTMDATVLPGQARVREEEIDCPYRGSYEIGFTHVAVTDLFGLVNLRLPMRHTGYFQPLRLNVEPRPIPLGSFELPTRISEGRLSRRVLSRVEASYADTRAYMVGDPMRRIHWKASVRRGSLLVKRYEGEERPDALILLDVNAHGREGLRRVQIEDLCVTTALSVAAHLLTRWIPVRFVAYDPERVQFLATKPTDISALSTYLAFAPFGRSYPMQDIIGLELAGTSAHTSVVVVTPLMTDHLFGALESMRARGVHLCVYLCAAPMEKYDLSERQIAALRGKGAQARLILHEDELRDTRGGAA